jgi:hypothetical protein
MKKLLTILLLFVSYNLFAQAPDYSHSLNITWTVDPGCYYRAGGTPARGRAIISGGTVCADNGQHLRGTFMRVLPNDPAYWANHALADQTYLDMTTKRGYNCVRAFCYYGTQPPLDTNTVRTVLRNLVDKCAQWGVYVLINLQTFYIGSDSTFVNKWWDAVAPAFKDDANVIMCAIDEPTTDWTGNGNYGSWADWRTWEVDYQESLYHRIRARAPNSMIIMWENMLVEAELSTRLPLPVIQEGSQINYSNAAVGFHAYPYLSPGNTYNGHPTLYYYQQLMNAGYPIFMTSWTANEGSPPGGLHNFRPTADSMEAYGISWIELDGFPGYTPYVSILSPYPSEAPPATSDVYHVRQSGGSDANDGTTYATAWATIGKANSILVPGDSVYIYSGTYTESINPANSSSSGNIIYYGVPGQTVKITTASTPGIVLDGDSRVFIENIWIANCWQAGNFYNSSNIYLNNVTLDSLTGEISNYSMFKINTCHDIKINKSVFDRKQGYQNDPLVTPYHLGDGLQIWASYNIEIDSSTFRGNPHYGIASYGGCHDIIVKNSLFTHNHGGAGIGFSSDQITYDNCTFEYQMTKERAGTLLQMNLDTVRVRFCTFTKDTVTVFRLTSPDIDVSPLVSFYVEESGMTTSYVRFYNNTIVNYDNAQGNSIGITDESTRQTTNFRFQNNIFVDPRRANTTIANKRVLNEMIRMSSNRYTLSQMNSTWNVLFSNNYFYRVYSATGDSLVWYRDSNNDWSFINRAGMTSSLGTMFPTSNVEANPQITGTVPDVSSPVIDKSLAQTTIVGTGDNSSSMTVADPTWFFKGWSNYISTILGDSIYFGRFSRSFAIRRITAINGAVLTLDRPADWVNGDSVWVYQSKHWVGYYPDLGSTEYRAGTQEDTTIVIPPSVPILVTPATGDTAVSTFPITQWNAANGAVKYIYEISIDSTFTTSLLKDSSYSLSIPSWSSKLANDTKYFWRVRSVSAEPLYSDYSTVGYFTTISRPVRQKGLYRSQ